MVRRFLLQTCTYITMDTTQASPFDTQISPGYVRSNLFTNTPKMILVRRNVQELINK